MGGGWGVGASLSREGARRARRSAPFLAPEEDGRLLTDHGFLAAGDETVRFFVVDRRRGRELAVPIAAAGSPSRARGRRERRARPRPRRFGARHTSNAPEKYTRHPSLSHSSISRMSRSLKSCRRTKHLNSAEGEEASAAVGVESIGAHPQAPPPPKAEIRARRGRDAGRSRRPISPANSRHNRFATNDMGQKSAWDFPTRG